jgi:predicted RNA-binding protein
MTRWICISNRVNEKITREKNIWGVAKRYINPISRVKIGDTLLMYTIKEISNKVSLPSEITAEYEVTSEKFEDEKPIFVMPENLGDEKFPFRIKIKPIQIFKEPIPFKPLIPSLSFIKNKKMWSGSIRTAMREIPEEDYQKIIRAKNLKIK